MNDRTMNRLLAIVSAALAASGLFLILMQIFSETSDNRLLAFGLMAVILSNLFNIIRCQRNRFAELNAPDAEDG